MPYNGGGGKAYAQMIERQTIESLDERLVNVTRFFLALSALVIIYIDPSEPDRLVHITYAALALYTLYSGIVYVVFLRRKSLLPGDLLHWIDVAWYLLLISLSSGTSSLFFFFFFFVILVASFRSGYGAGLRVTIVSAILFVTIGYMTTPAPIEANRFLLRAVYLTTIGYLMAYWGGSEITHKRKLALLKDVSQLSNPRFGVDRTIGSFIAKLRDFYAADTCFLITTASQPNEYLLRKVDRRHPELGNRTETVGPEGEEMLSLWPPEWAVTFHRSASKWSLKKMSYAAYDLLSGERLKHGPERCAWVADLLETDSFVSIPVYQRKSFTGRLYLTSKRRRFSYSDVEFLRQVIEHVVPMIDNVRLVDRFASEASEYERQRISRDIHDSAIQPYIGLKLGLDALRRQVPQNDPVSAGLAELAEKTDSVINDLRTYVGGLKERGSSHFVNVLVSSLQRHARKFGELYDIEVDVRAAAEIDINDRLAAEIFQIVQEGLSNIKRHTASSRATISLRSRNGDMFLDIENECPGPVGKTFTPRSITDRAVALGGRVSVTVRDDGHTIVSVIIPM